MTADFAAPASAGSGSSQAVSSSQGTESAAFSTVLKGEATSQPAENLPRESAKPAEQGEAANEPVKEAKTETEGNALPEEGKPMPADGPEVTVTAEEKALLEQLAAEGDELAKSILENLSEENTIPVAALEAIKQKLPAGTEDSSAVKALTALQGRALSGTEGEGVKVSSQPMADAVAPTAKGPEATTSLAGRPSAAAEAQAQVSVNPEADAPEADNGLKKMLEQRLESLAGKQPVAQNSSTVATFEAPRVQTQQSAPAPTVPQAPVTLRQDGLDQALSNSVQWMSKQNLQEANIRVRPAELGPINVKVSMQDDQLKLSFTASHAATREALESALPRLREVFNASGMNLGNVDVNDQGLAKQFQQNEYSENGGEPQGSWRSAGGSGEGAEAEVDVLTTALPSVSETSSAVDVFA